WGDYVEEGYVDEDNVEEDDQIDQEVGVERLSQDDEEEETLTRRTRSKVPRAPGRTKTSKPQPSTRLRRAQKDREEKLVEGVRREKKRLKARHSFMTKEVYEAPGQPGYPGPDPAFVDSWDDDDEADFIETYWTGTTMEHLTSLPDFTGRDRLAQAFRASLHVFKIDPLTLFTKGLNDIVIDKDEKSSKTINGRPYTNQFWSGPFCDKLSRIIYHPLWYGPEPWAFMLFALKWAAICRTDDRRSLHEDDLGLLEKNHCIMEEDPTLSYPDIHVKQQRSITLRGGIPSPQAQLLSEIANFSKKIGRPPGDYYHIITSDLTAVIDGLNSLRDAFDHDCEFYFLMFSEAHEKELYPKDKEMSAVYKNCYLSVERKKLFDFKVHGHNLAYLEQHHLRKPSDMPVKFRVSSSNREELEGDILSQLLQQNIPEPDENPFNETAPEAADDGSGAPVIIQSDEDDEDNLGHEDHHGNSSDSYHGEEAEPHEDASALFLPETSDDEAPQDTAGIPASQETREEHPTTRDDLASSPPPSHQRATQSRNDRLDTSPPASELRGLLSQRELGSPTLNSRVNLEGGGDQSMAFSPVLPPLPPQKTTKLRNRHDQDTAASPNRAPPPMHKPTPTSQDDSEDENVPGARKRKNNSDDTRPQKAIHKDDALFKGMKPILEEPRSGSTDMLSTVDGEEPQPRESRVKPQGRRALPSLSDVGYEHPFNFAHRYPATISMNNPSTYRTPGRNTD
ncbi:hypothetical protein ACHAP5_012032, partial [Fusarium lateritium]